MTLQKVLVSKDLEILLELFEVPIGKLTSLVCHMLGSENRSSVQFHFFRIEILPCRFTLVMWLGARILKFERPLNEKFNILWDLKKILGDYGPYCEPLPLPLFSFIFRHREL